MVTRQQTLDFGCALVAPQDRPQANGWPGVTAVERLQSRKISWRRRRTDARQLIIVRDN